MSRIMRSTVGIILTLTLGATAAYARPLNRAAVREAAPAGVAERVWSWWNSLLERAAPAGRGGLSALAAKAGSQMDPNGGAVGVLLTRPASPATDL
ncbi:MAG TPA: hypothetical protein VGR07_07405 [Thermoanaerobaculia bacterium]|jgi:hypothetical protein|nr:hypothetical protein [Thermoanaerobaculia bacterium]